MMTFIATTASPIKQWVALHILSVTMMSTPQTSVALKQNSLVTYYCILLPNGRRNDLDIERFMLRMCTRAHTIRCPTGNNKATSCLKHRNYFPRSWDTVVGRALHKARSWEEGVERTLQATGRASKYGKEKAEGSQVSGQFLPRCTGCPSES